MSIETKNPDTAHAESGRTSVPLDDIESYLMNYCESVDRDENSISFEVGCGRTTIEVEPVNIATTDGHEVTDIVTIRTELEPSLTEMSDEFLSVANLFCVLGAAIRDPDTGVVSIAARHSVYRGDWSAWRLYTPLIAGSALVQADGLIQGVRAIRGHEVPGNPRDGQLPSRWVEDEFLLTAEHLANIDIEANVEPASLTANLMLGDKGSTERDGENIALLSIQADLPHPGLGNGLTYGLWLPKYYQKDEAIRLSHALNRWELDGIDSPPFFGAWATLTENQQLAFTGFIPNAFYVTGSATNVCSWLIVRALNARAFIENQLAYDEGQPDAA